MFAFLSNLVSGLAAFFRLSEKRSDLANSADMQANARAKLDQASRDAAIKAVATDDLEAIRRQAAEK
jgi:hypothetical protein